MHFGCGYDIIVLTRQSYPLVARNDPRQSLAELLSGVVSFLHNGTADINRRLITTFSFCRQANSQTQTIISLQQRTAALESDLTEQEDGYKAKIGELNGTVLDLNAALAKAQETAATAVTAKEQADKIAALATDKAEQLETEVQELKDKANASDEYRTKSEQLFAEVEKLKVEVERLQSMQRTSEREYTKTLDELKAKATEEKTKIEREHKREIEIEVKSAKIEVAEKYQAQIEKLQQQYSAQIKELLLSKSAD